MLLKISAPVEGWGQTKYLKEVNRVGFIHAKIRDPFGAIMVYYPEE